MDTSSSSSWKARSVTARGRPARTLRDQLPRLLLTPLRSSRVPVVQISPWRYVDLPGHASQRVKLETLRSVSKAVVFVVDGTAPQAISKVAQLLYTLLVDPVFTARKTPFFIAINKIDQLEGGQAKAKATNDGETNESDDDEEDSSTGNSAVDAFAARLEKILSVRPPRRECARACVGVLPFFWCLIHFPFPPPPPPSAVIPLAPSSRR